MFRKNKPDDNLAGPRSDVLTRPLPAMPKFVVAPEARMSYRELADDLGFRPAELVRAELIEFFVTNQIPLFDYNAVAGYLTAKKVQEGAKKWCWRPLREKDAVDYSWSTNEYGWIVDGGYNSSRGECPPYQRLVPQHALEKVMMVEAAFGPDARFFVSDYPAVLPDPFIMVVPSITPSGSMSPYILIFDVWDEPDFGS